mgnify:CR=1 FL=1
MKAIKCVEYMCMYFPIRNKMLKLWLKRVKCREGNGKVLNNKQSEFVIQPVGHWLEFHLSRLTLACCKRWLKKRTCRQDCWDCRSRSGTMHILSCSKDISQPKVCIFTWKWRCLSGNRRFLGETLSKKLSINYSNLFFLFKRNKFSQASFSSI